MAARRGGCQPFGIKRIACPTGNDSPLDLQREILVLSNRILVLVLALTGPKSTGCQKRKTAEGAGTHLDSNQSLANFKFHSLHVSRASIAEVVR